LDDRKKIRKEIGKKDAKYTKDIKGSAGRDGYSDGRGKSSMEVCTQDWNKKHKTEKRLKR